MALSTEHRASLVAGLSPVVGGSAAEALVDHLPANENEEPATAAFVQQAIDASVRDISGEMTLGFATVRTEAADLGQALRSEIADLGEVLRSEIADQAATLRTEGAAEIGVLRAELATESEVRRTEMRALAAVVRAEFETLGAAISSDVHLALVQQVRWITALLVAALGAVSGVAVLAITVLA